MAIRPRFVTSAWDGIYTVEFTLDRVYQRCYMLGQELLQRKWGCLIAYDTRFLSNLFALSIYHALQQQGINVTLSPAPIGVPALQWALGNRTNQCGLLVSAGNRPYWYNGLVLVEPAGTERLPDIRKLPTGWLPATPAFPPPEAPLTPTGMATAVPQIRHVRQEYIEMLRTLIDLELIRTATLTIISDTMNGTTAGLLPAIIGEGNYSKAVEINREADPLFSYTTPLPATASLARLRKLVHESDSHLGLAFSADGSALTVIDKSGEQVDPLDLALTLATYLVRQQRQRGLVVAPPPPAGSPLEVAAQHMDTWEQALGCKVELTSNAAARIAELGAQENNTLLVGITAEGACVLSRYTAYPDAIITGLLTLELVARSGGSLRTQIDAVRARLIGSS